jgi:hypothetical protein
MTAVFNARLTLTARNGEVREMNGQIMQLRNGDLFFRPIAAEINNWNTVSEGQLFSVAFSNVTPLTGGSRLFVSAYNTTISDRIVCFTAGTMIATPAGVRAVETLAVGDLVSTLDRGAQPVRWISSRKIALLGGADDPLRPVRIAAGALGVNMPAQDLLVSPQHRMLVRSRIAQTLFGADEVLVAAKHLLGLPGVALAEDVTEIVYVHFLCDQHEVVIANGAPSETMLTGAVALAAVGAEALEEIYAIFPELRGSTDKPLGARRLLTGKEGRKLVQRHQKNARALVLAA